MPKSCSLRIFSSIRSTQPSSQSSRASLPIRHSDIQDSNPSKTKSTGSMLSDRRLRATYPYSPTTTLPHALHWAASIMDSVILSRTGMTMNLPLGPETILETSWVSVLGNGASGWPRMSHRLLLIRNMDGCMTPVVYTLMGSM